MLGSLVDHLDLPGRKAALRDHMKTVRAAIPERIRESDRAATTATVIDLPQLRTAKTVALFAPMGAEMDVRPLARILSEKGVRIAVPVVVEPLIMEFVEVTPEHLEAPRTEQPDFLGKPATHRGLPDGFTVVREDEFDVMIMPGLAFDGKRRRLGYGGGFCDVYLSRPGLRADTIAPIYELQLIDEVPYEELDRLVDTIVTPTRIITA